MKMTQKLEQEEVRSRVKKEQLHIETELAAANAKLKVYEEFEDAHESMNDLLEPVSRSRAGSRYCKLENDDEQCGARKTLPALSILILPMTCIKYCSVKMKLLRCSSSNKVCLSCHTETYQCSPEILLCTDLS